MVALRILCGVNLSIRRSNVGTKKVQCTKVQFQFPGPLYIVGFQSVAQLGGLVQGYLWLVPLRLRLMSLFYYHVCRIRLKGSFSEI